MLDRPALCTVGPLRLRVGAASGLCCSPELLAPLSYTTYKGLPFIRLPWRPAVEAGAACRAAEAAGGHRQVAVVRHSALLRCCLALGSHLTHQLNGVLEAQGRLHECQKTHGASTCEAVQVPWPMWGAPLVTPLCAFQTIWPPEGTLAAMTDPHLGRSW